MWHQFSILVAVVAIFVIGQEPAGDCTTAGNLFALNGNRSILVDSLTAGCATFNGTQCTNFRAYIRRIDIGVVRNASVTTDRQRVSFFTYIVDNYVGRNALRRAVVLSVPMSNGWGNVQQLTDCSRQD